MGGTASLRLYGEPRRALLTKPKLAKGCELCFMGVKAVIFVTGLCEDGCFYCPVNREKLGKDVFYVNEEPVNGVDDVILEVARIGATSASITGGDPLARPDRTIMVIRALKEHFGPDFHIHLYTSGRYLTQEMVRMLDYVGLDEIRFHPTKLEFLEKIELAKLYSSMSVGVEIPVGPGLEKWAKNIILESERRGAEFVNLNELEFVEPNARELLARGLKESKKRPFTVEGSLEVAIRILEWARENVSIPVHFCPASFKDNIQTKNRLRRAARTDTRWYEVPTPQGTLRYGLARGDPLPPDVRLVCAEGEGRILEVYPTRQRTPIIDEEIVECG